MNTEFFLSNGNSINSQHPSLTRRFPRYAKRKGLSYSNFDTIDNLNGIIVVNQAADLTFWTKNKAPNAKLIFDANDSYLLDEKWSSKRKLRGLFKYLSGKHKYLKMNYDKTYLKMCEISDVVLVGHFLQYEKLLKISKKVVLLPDYPIEKEIEVKKDYSIKPQREIHVFWEGLGSSYLPFKDINRIFTPLKTEYKFVFHFVTDLSFFAVGNLFNKKYTFELAKKEAPNFYSDFRFYQWSEFAMNKLAVACDIAVIPLPLDYSLNYYKPENKLIHMWRMAVPTIVSGIPSYKKVMDDVGLSHYCFNDDQWRETLDCLLTNIEIRRLNGTKGFNYANEYYSNERIDRLWDSVIFNV